MNAPKYNLSTRYHVDHCKRMAESGNMMLLRSALRYAMYDLGLSQD